MDINFSSSTVDILEEYEPLIIAFTDNNEVFMIQYSTTEDDKQKIYFERNDQNQCCWDEIENLTLNSKQLHIVFTNKGANEIYCNEIKIDFEIDIEKRNELFEKMRFIFKNKSYAKIID